MKIFYKSLIFLILYALLAIPDNRSSLNIPEKDGLVISSKWWGKFAQNLVKFRITSESNQRYYYDKHRGLLTQHLDDLLLQLTEPDNPILDSIRFHINKLSALASLVPNKTMEFEEDVSRWRKLLKYQSRYWDTSEKVTNQRLFQLITESRLAFESALIQSNTESASISTIETNSQLKTVKVGELVLKSGDILAFNHVNRDNPSVAFIKELPNAFKQLGSVFISDNDASVIYVDHEQGLHIVPVQEFFEKIAPNGAVLRLRDDIPTLLSNPELPDLAASTISEMAKNGGYRYDYKFDSETNDYIYDWELINTVYKVHSLNLEPNQFIRADNSIHVGTRKPHIEAFEIELDHRFIIAGEWYNAELLYNNRLLTAATASIIRSNKKSDFVSPILLPIYRVIKAYSMVVGNLGLHQPIPTGVTAQTQMVYDALGKEQKKLVLRLQSELSKYELDQNHKATYLKMLQKADEITSANIAD